jgi:Mn-containing catalase
MEIREHVLEYLKTLKETQNVANPDESDILEQEKLVQTKRVYSDFRNRVYTEKEYWEGKVPDDQFESYLNKYGYEYTPVPEIKLSQRARHSDLDAL